jgi:hypothetical protein
MACAAVGYVDPTFQEDAAAAMLVYDVQPAFQPNKISPGFRFGLRQERQGLGALARP